MFEDDQETLAAEYVLGTLSGEEREHAEALRSFDPEFDAAVRAAYAKLEGAAFRIAESMYGDAGQGA